MKILDEISIKVDTQRREDLMQALQSCIGTKFAFRWGTLISDLAL